MDKQQKPSLFVTNLPLGERKRSPADSEELARDYLAFLQAWGVTTVVDPYGVLQEGATRKLPRALYEQLTAGGIAIQTLSGLHREDTSAYGNFIAELLALTQTRGPVALLYDPELFDPRIAPDTKSAPAEREPLDRRLRRAYQTATQQLTALTSVFSKAGQRSAHLWAFPPAQRKQLGPAVSVHANRFVLYELNPDQNYVDLAFEKLAYNAAQQHFAARAASAPPQPAPSPVAPPSVTPPQPAAPGSRRRIPSLNNVLIDPAHVPPLTPERLASYQQAFPTLAASDIEQLHTLLGGADLRYAYGTPDFVRASDALLRAHVRARQQRGRSDHFGGRVPQLARAHETALRYVRLGRDPEHELLFARYREAQRAFWMARADAAGLSPERYAQTPSVAEVRALQRVSNVKQGATLEVLRADAIAAATQGLTHAEQLVDQLLGGKPFATVRIARDLYLSVRKAAEPTTYQGAPAIGLDTFIYRLKDGRRFTALEAQARPLNADELGDPLQRLHLQARPLGTGGRYVALLQGRPLVPSVRIKTGPLKEGELPYDIGYDEQVWKTWEESRDSQYPFERVVAFRPLKSRGQPIRLTDANKPAWNYAGLRNALNFSLGDLAAESRRLAQRLGLFQPGQDDDEEGDDRPRTLWRSDEELPRLSLLQLGNPDEVFRPWLLLSRTHALQTEDPVDQTRAQALSPQHPAPGEEPPGAREIVSLGALARLGLGTRHPNSFIVRAMASSTAGAYPREDAASGTVSLVGVKDKNALKALNIGARPKALLGVDPRVAPRPLLAHRVAARERGVAPDVFFAQPATSEGEAAAAVAPRDLVVPRHEARDAFLYRESPVSGHLLETALVMSGSLVGDGQADTLRMLTAADLSVQRLSVPKRVAQAYGAFVGQRFEDIPTAGGERIGLTSGGRAVVRDVRVVGTDPDDPQRDIVEFELFQTGRPFAFDSGGAKAFSMYRETLEQMVISPEYDPTRGGAYDPSRERTDVVVAKANVPRAMQAAALGGLSVANPELFRALAGAYAQPDPEATVSALQSFIAQYQAEYAARGETPLSEAEIAEHLSARRRALEAQPLSEKAREAAAQLAAGQGVPLDETTDPLFTALSETLLVAAARRRQVVQKVAPELAALFVGPQALDTPYGGGTLREALASGQNARRRMALERFEAASKAGRAGGFGASPIFSLHPEQPYDFRMDVFNLVAQQQLFRLPVLYAPENVSAGESGVGTTFVDQVWIDPSRMSERAREVWARYQGVEERAARSVLRAAEQQANSAGVLSEGNDASPGELSLHDLFEKQLYLRAYGPDDDPAGRLANALAIYYENPSDVSARARAFYELLPPPMRDLTLGAVVSGARGASKSAVVLPSAEALSKMIGEYPAGTVGELARAVFGNDALLGGLWRALEEGKPPQLGTGNVASIPSLVARLADGPHGKSSGRLRRLALRQRGPGGALPGAINTALPIGTAMVDDEQYFETLAEAMSVQAGRAVSYSEAQTWYREKLLPFFQTAYQQFGAGAFEMSILPTALLYRSPHIKAGQASLVTPIPRSLGEALGYTAEGDVDDGRIVFGPYEAAKQGGDVDKDLYMIGLPFIAHDAARDTFEVLTRAPSEALRQLLPEKLLRAKYDLPPLDAGAYLTTLDPNDPGKQIYSWNENVQADYSGLTPLQIVSKLVAKHGALGGETLEREVVNTYRSKLEMGAQYNETAGLYFWSGLLATAGGVTAEKEETDALRNALAAYRYASYQKALDSEPVGPVQQLFGHLFRLYSAPVNLSDRERPEPNAPAQQYANLENQRLLNAMAGVRFARRKDGQLALESLVSEDVIARLNAPLAVRRGALETDEKVALVPIDSRRRKEALGAARAYVTQTRALFTTALEALQKGEGGWSPTVQRGNERVALSRFVAPDSPLDLNDYPNFMAFASGLLDALRAADETTPPEVRAAYAAYRDALGTYRVKMYEATYNPAVDSGTGVALTPFSMFDDFVNKKPEYEQSERIADQSLSAFGQVAALAAGTFSLTGRGALPASTVYAALDFFVARGFDDVRQTAAARVAALAERAIDFDIEGTEVPVQPPAVPVVSDVQFGTGAGDIAYLGSMGFYSLDFPLLPGQRPAAGGPIVFLPPASAVQSEGLEQRVLVPDQAVETLGNQSPALAGLQGSAGNYTIPISTLVAHARTLARAGVDALLGFYYGTRVEGTEDGEYTEWHTVMVPNAAQFEAHFLRRPTETTAARYLPDEESPARTRSAPTKQPAPAPVATPAVVQSLVAGAPPAPPAAQASPSAPAAPQPAASPALPTGLMEYWGDLWAAREDLIRQGYEPGKVAIALPVNTGKVLGSGLALAAKRRYAGTEFENKYKDAIRSGKLKLGEPYVMADFKEKDGTPSPIVLFATKGENLDTSTNIEDVRSGLLNLLQSGAIEPDTALVLPMLGGGAGRLDWGEIDEVYAQILPGKQTAVIVRSGAQAKKIARGAGREGDLNVKFKPFQPLPRRTPQASRPAPPAQTPPATPAPAPTPQSAAAQPSQPTPPSQPPAAPPPAPSAQPAPSGGLLTFGYRGITDAEVRALHEALHARGITTVVDAMTGDDNKLASFVGRLNAIRGKERLKALQIVPLRGLGGLAAANEPSPQTNWRGQRIVDYQWVVGGRPSFKTDMERLLEMLQRGSVALAAPDLEVGESHRVRLVGQYLYEEQRAGRLPAFPIEHFGRGRDILSAEVRPHKEALADLLTDPRWADEQRRTSKQVYNLRDARANLFGSIPDDVAERMRQMASFHDKRRLPSSFQPVVWNTPEVPTPTPPAPQATPVPSAAGPSPSTSPASATNLRAAPADVDAPDDAPPGALEPDEPPNVDETLPPLNFASLLKQLSQSSSAQAMASSAPSLGADVDAPDEIPPGALEPDEPPNVDESLEPLSFSSLLSQLSQSPSAQAPAASAPAAPPPAPPSPPPTPPAQPSGPAGGTGGDKRPPLQYVLPPAFMLPPGASYDPRRQLPAKLEPYNNFFLSILTNPRMAMVAALGMPDTPEQMARLDRLLTSGLSSLLRVSPQPTQSMALPGAATQLAKDFELKVLEKWEQGGVSARAQAEFASLAAKANLLPYDSRYETRRHGIILSFGENGPRLAVTRGALQTVGLRDGRREVMQFVFTDRLQEGQLTPGEKVWALAVRQLGGTATSPARQLGVRYVDPYFFQLRLFERLAKAQFVDQPQAGQAGQPPRDVLTAVADMMRRNDLPGFIAQYAPLQQKVSIEGAEGGPYRLGIVVARALYAAHQDTVRYFGSTRSTAWTIDLDQLADEAQQDPEVLRYAEALEAYYDMLEQRPSDRASPTSVQNPSRAHTLFYNLQALDQLGAAEKFEYTSHATGETKVEDAGVLRERLGRFYASTRSEQERQKHGLDNPQVAFKAFLASLPRDGDKPSESPEKWYTALRGELPRTFEADEALQAWRERVAFLGIEPDLKGRQWRVFEKMQQLALNLKEFPQAALNKWRTVLSALPSAQSTDSLLNALSAVQARPSLARGEFLGIPGGQSFVSAGLSSEKAEALEAATLLYQLAHVDPDLSEEDRTEIQSQIDAIRSIDTLVQWTTSSVQPQAAQQPPPQAGPGATAQPPPQVAAGAAGQPPPPPAPPPQVAAAAAGQPAPSPTPPPQAAGGAAGQPPPATPPPPSPPPTPPAQPPAQPPGQPPQVPPGSPLAFGGGMVTGAIPVVYQKQFTAGSLRELAEAVTKIGYHVGVSQSDLDLVLGMSARYVPSTVAASSSAYPTDWAAPIYLGKTGAAHQALRDLIGLRFADLTKQYRDSKLKGTAGLRPGQVLALNEAVRAYKSITTLLPSMYAPLRALFGISMRPDDVAGLYAPNVSASARGALRELLRSQAGQIVAGIAGPLRTGLGEIVSAVEAGASSQPDVTQLVDSVLQRFVNPQNPVAQASAYKQLDQQTRNMVRDVLLRVAHRAIRGGDDLKELKALHNQVKTSSDLSNLLNPRTTVRGLAPAELIQRRMGAAAELFSALAVYGHDAQAGAPLALNVMDAFLSSALPPEALDALQQSGLSITAPSGSALTVRGLLGELLQPGSGATLRSAADETGVVAAAGESGAQLFTAQLVERFPLMMRANVFIDLLDPDTRALWRDTTQEALLRQEAYALAQSPFAAHWKRGRPVASLQFDIARYAPTVNALIDRLEAAPELAEAFLRDPSSYTDAEREARLQAFLEGELSGVERAWWMQFAKDAPRVRKFLQQVGGALDYLPEAARTELVQHLEQAGLGYLADDDPLGRRAVLERIGLGVPYGSLMGYTPGSLVGQLAARDLKQTRAAAARAPRAPKFERADLERLNALLTQMGVPTQLAGMDPRRLTLNDYWQRMIRFPYERALQGDREQARAFERNAKALLEASELFERAAGADTPEARAVRRLFPEQLRDELATARLFLTGVEPDPNDPDRPYVITESMTGEVARVLRAQSPEALALLQAEREAEALRRLQLRILPREVEAGNYAAAVQAFGDPSQWGAALAKMREQLLAGGVAPEQRDALMANITALERLTELERARTALGGDVWSFAQTRDALLAAGYTEAQLERAGLEDIFRQLTPQEIGKLNVGQRRALLAQGRAALGKLGEPDAFVEARRVAKAVPTQFTGRAEFEAYRTRLEASQARLQAVRPRDDKQAQQRDELVEKLQEAAARAERVRQRHEASKQEMQARVQDLRARVAKLADQGELAQAERDQFEQKLSQYDQYDDPSQLTDELLKQLNDLDEQIAQREDEPKVLAKIEEALGQLSPEALQGAVARDATVTDARAALEKQYRAAQPQVDEAYKRLTELREQLDSPVARRAAERLRDRAQRILKTYGKRLYDDKLLAQDEAERKQRREAQSAERRRLAEKKYAEQAAAFERERERLQEAWRAQFGLAEATPVAAKVRKSVAARLGALAPEQLSRRGLTLPEARDELARIEEAAHQAVLVDAEQLIHMAAMTDAELLSESQAKMRELRELRERVAKQLERARQTPGVPREVVRRLGQAYDVSGRRLRAIERNDSKAQEAAQQHVRDLEKIEARAAAEQSRIAAKEKSDLTAVRARAEARQQEIAARGELEQKRFDYATQKEAQRHEHTMAEIEARGTVQRQGIEARAAAKQEWIDAQQAARNERETQRAQREQAARAEREAQEARAREEFESILSFYEETLNEQAERAGAAPDTFAKAQRVFKYVAQRARAERPPSPQWRRTALKFLADHIGPLPKTLARAERQQAEEARKALMIRQRAEGVYRAAENDVRRMRAQFGEALPEEVEQLFSQMQQHYGASNYTALLALRQSWAQVRRAHSVPEPIRTATTVVAQGARTDISDADLDALLRRLEPLLKESEDQMGLRAARLYGQLSALQARRRAAQGAGQPEAAPPPDNSEVALRAALGYFYARTSRTAAEALRLYAGFDPTAPDGTPLEEGAAIQQFVARDSAAARNLARALMRYTVRGATALMRDDNLTPSDLDTLAARDTLAIDLLERMARLSGTPFEAQFAPFRERLQQALQGRVATGAGAAATPLTSEELLKLRDQVGAAEAEVETPHALLGRALDALTQSDLSQLSVSQLSDSLAALRRVRTYFDAGGALRSDADIAAAGAQPLTAAERVMFSEFGQQFATKAEAAEAHLVFQRDLRRFQTLSHAEQVKILRERTFAHTGADSAPANAFIYESEQMGALLQQMAAPYAAARTHGEQRAFDARVLGAYIDQAYADDENAQAARQGARVYRPVLHAPLTFVQRASRHVTLRPRQTDQTNDGQAGGASAGQMRESNAEWMISAFAEAVEKLDERGIADMLRDMARAMDEIRPEAIRNAQELFKTLGEAVEQIETPLNELRKVREQLAAARSEKDEGEPQHMKTLSELAARETELMAQLRRYTQPDARGERALEFDEASGEFREGEGLRRARGRRDALGRVLGLMDIARHMYEEEDIDTDYNPLAAYYLTGPAGRRARARLRRSQAYQESPMLIPFGGVDEAGNQRGLRLMDVQGYALGAWDRLMKGMYMVASIQTFTSRPAQMAAEVYNQYVQQTGQSAVAMGIARLSDYRNTLTDRIMAARVNRDLAIGEGYRRATGGLELLFNQVVGSDFLGGLIGTYSTPLAAGSLTGFLFQSKVGGLAVGAGLFALQTVAQIIANQGEPQHVARFAHNTASNPIGGGLANLVELFLNPAAGFDYIGKVIRSVFGSQRDSEALIRATGIGLMQYDFGKFVSVLQNWGRRGYQGSDDDNRILEALYTIESNLVQTERGLRIAASDVEAMGAGLKDVDGFRGFTRAETVRGMQALASAYSYDEFRRFIQQPDSLTRLKRLVSAVALGIEPSALAEAMSASYGVSYAGPLTPSGAPFMRGAVERMMDTPDTLGAMQFEQAYGRWYTNVSQMRASLGRAPAPPLSYWARARKVDDTVAQAQLEALQAEDVRLEGEQLMVTRRYGRLGDQIVTRYGLPTLPESGLPPEALAALPPEARSAFTAARVAQIDKAALTTPAHLQLAQSGAPQEYHDMLSAMTGLPYVSLASTEEITRGVLSAAALQRAGLTATARRAIDVAALSTWADSAQQQGREEDARRLRQEGDIRANLLNAQAGLEKFAKTLGYATDEIHNFIELGLVRDEQGRIDQTLSEATYSELASILPLGLDKTQLGQLQPMVRALAGTGLIQTAAQLAPSYLEAATQPLDARAASSAFMSTAQMIHRWRTEEKLSLPDINLRVQALGSANALVASLAAQGYVDQEVGDRLRKRYTALAPAARTQYAQALNVMYPAAERGLTATTDLADRARDLAESQDIAGARRLNERAAEVFEHEARAQLYRGEVYTLDLADRLAGMDRHEYARLMGAASGDPLLLAQFAETYGAMDLYTVQTGKRGGTPGMFAGYDEPLTLSLAMQFRDADIKRGGVGTLAALQAGAPEIAGMNYVQLEATQNRLQYEQMQFGFRQQELNLRRRRELTSGSGLVTEGFAMVGSGLNARAVVRDLARESGLADAVATWKDAGEKLQDIIKGLNEWKIEDREIRLRREQQERALEDTLKGREFNWKRFEMEGRHWYERFYFQRNVTMTQFDWQQQDMAINRARQVQQFRWNFEDIYYSRNKMNVQFGWQMEDIDRNLRYARGIERYDLMRQRERAVVEYSMEMGRSQRDERRLRTQEGWAAEDFEREQRRFEQRKQWAIEEMEMERRHFEERRALRLEELMREDERIQKQRQWFEEERQLEDARIAMKRAAYLVDQKEAENLAQYSKQMQLNFTAIGKAMEAIGSRNKETEAFVGHLVRTGQMLTRLVGVTNNAASGLERLGVSVVNFVQRIVGALQTLQGRPAPSQPAPRSGGGAPVMRYDSGGYVHPDRNFLQWMPERSFAGGGFTGHGAKHMPAGIVHAGEYVVPQEGALVLRGGDAKTHELLEKIVAVLKQIADNKGDKVNINVTAQRVQDALEAALSPYDSAFARFRQ